MREPALLADHLDEQTDTILAVWRATVERDGDVPEAERLSDREFLDHVPALLDRLADRLRGRPADVGAEGRKHGEHRWRQGYDVGALINEFEHLRTALCRATAQYARENDWGLSRLEGAFEAINDVLGEAAAESVRQFQDDSQAQTRMALAEACDRQRAAEQAREIARSEQDKLRTILASLPVAVWVVDAAGTFVAGNNLADEIHASVDPSYIGRTNVHNLGPRYRLFRSDRSPYLGDELPLCRALQGETVLQEELIWEIRGEPHTLLVNAVPLRTGSGVIDGAVSVAQDVSERKRAEEELLAHEEALKEQRARAEEASQHKTRLVAALSHDIRTPLNAVVLAVQLLEIHLKGAGTGTGVATGTVETAPDVEIQESLRTIRHSVKNVLDLLGDLLDLTKIDAGVVRPEVSQFALDPVLAECLASIEPQARLKGLDIRLEPGNLTGRSLETDRAKLKQILANFLSNAVRYTERGRVGIGAELRAGQVRIAVADTGVGIDSRDQEKIFDEFAVLEHPRRRIGEGTGLGLAICRRLAGLLRGSITLASAPGSGSTFSLVLPDSVLVSVTSASASGAETDSDSAPDPEARAAVARPRDGLGAIVVAEDHDESRQTLARVLRRLGYLALEATNGREALDLIESSRPLAVLMDVNMPVMDGVDATLALRGDPRWRDIPIFALTGDVTPDNQRRIGEAGVTGYLEKPVNLELLKQALTALNGRQPA
jgi:signal transduction histidine kinase/ActR/RegA family two-component response regulator